MATHVWSGCGVTQSSQYGPTLSKHCVNEYSEAGKRF